jgi:hypothetical protein
MSAIHNVDNEGDSDIAAGMKAMLAKLDTDDTQGAEA